MTLPVVFAARAERQLERLFAYIAAASGLARAEAFVGRIVACCEGLGEIPVRGMRRDDVAPGLRIVGFRRRTTIAFLVEPQVVVIVGVFYGGQDYEAVLRDDLQPDATRD